MNKFTLILLAATMANSIAMAVPAKRGRIEFAQPDGAKVVAYLHGDEYMHWYEDEAGAIMLCNDKGTLCYATMGKDGRPAPSGIKAGSARKTQAEAALIASQDREAILQGLGSMAQARR